ncbi:LysR family transcriptional regulator [Thalassomonas sp. RHCl1]|uniref:LysR family transcriptional regulator n=1 Tax=Thalassomonas sp. RHCl1 TaxID=2995320 RepID=UPI00248B9E89|nr:LysR family transcriptional regulator [Thalassomonas sp. RHCl1]
MNWDDIKIFLEVARSERLSQAAKRLALDPSTVSRRLHKLEEQLATQLFERTQDGHILTSDGERLLASARRMEQDASYALDDIKHNNAQNSGCVRIGVTEAFGNFFIAPNLLLMQQQFPNIQIDLLHFSRYVKISRNEADIAIAVERPNSTSMIVSKLCDYTLQLYAHPDYLNKHKETVTLDNLAGHNWVSYVDNLLFTEQLSYLKELNADLLPGFRSTSVISQYSAIKSGLGIGILPCFLAAQDPGLVKLCAGDIKLVRSFWLVTHPEIKRLSRVNSVWHYLKQLVAEHQGLLMPKD